MSKKNRNGKPTEFQVKKLLGLGVEPKNVKALKTYRDAENALRRIANASKPKAAKIQVQAKKPAVAAKKPAAKPATAPAKKQQTAPQQKKCVCNKNSCTCNKRNSALKKSDAADKLPIIKNGYSVQRVIIPAVNLDKAEREVLVSVINDLHDIMNECISVFGKVFG